MTLPQRFCRGAGAPNLFVCSLLWAALFSQVRPVFVQAQAGAGAKSASSGTLLLSSNIACRVFLDGEEAAMLAAGDVKKVPVELGDHLLVAKNDKGEVVWKKAVSVKSSAQILVEIGSAGAATASGSVPGSSKAESTLLVKTGVACTLSVNGKEAGDLAAGGSKQIAVTVGKQVVSAVGRKGARWEKTVVVKGPGPIILNVEFPRFEDQGDGTVLDTKTGLMWAKKNSEFDVDFEQANTYAEKLALGNQRDWRIPSIVELETLLKSAGRTGAAAAFELTDRCTLWSTTKDEGGLTLMYDRGSRIGYPAQARGNTRVLCVRGAAERVPNGRVQAFVDSCRKVVSSPPLAQSPRMETRRLIGERYGELYTVAIWPINRQIVSDAYHQVWVPRAEKSYDSAGDRIEKSGSYLSSGDDPDEVLWILSKYLHSHRDVPSALLEFQMSELKLMFSV